MVDRYSLKIITPQREIIGNVHPFVSGHYRYYGVNVQACADHYAHFTYIGLAGPGVLVDNHVIVECSLWKLIKNMPLNSVFGLRWLLAWWLGCCSCCLTTIAIFDKKRYLQRGIRWCQVAIANLTRESACDYDFLRRSRLDKNGRLGILKHQVETILYLVHVPLKRM